MLKRNIIIGFAVLIGVIFFFVKKAEDKRQIKSLEKHKVALQKKVKDSLSVGINLDSNFSYSEKKQIQQLWNEFKTYRHSGANALFQHSNFSLRPTKDSIIAVLDADGSLGLISTQLGNSPIHPQLIQLKIGNNYYDSLPLRGATNSIILGETVATKESLHLIGEFATPIIEQIALNTDAVIEVKLVGKNAYSSFTLNEKEKKAFRKTWELYQLLKG